jgi:protease I
LCGLAVAFLLMIAAAACSGSAALPTEAPTAAPTPSPTPECIPWYEAPDHLEETTCVEGRILHVRNADTPNPRVAFFIFDPVFNDFDFEYGKFYACVYSDDWCEYFPHCRRQGQYRAELDGTCAHVFGTIEEKWGSRIRIVVKDRSQMEYIDCSACQHSDACAPPQTEPTGGPERGSVLMVIAPSGFNDDEYSGTRDVLVTNGYTVAVASRSMDLANGQYGMLEAQPDVLVTEVEAVDYDAIVFVSGEGSAVYWDDREAHRVAQEALEQGKVLAAIGTAPVILARAGILQGREAAVYDPATYCPHLEAEGAICTRERVQRDGRIVTARLEGAAEEFAEAIFEVLQEE